MTKGHWLGIGIGVLVGVLVVNVLVPRIPRWMGLRKKPPAPIVINGDM
jgi:hypothetical protein